MYLIRLLLERVIFVSAEATTFFLNFFSYSIFEVNSYPVFLNEENYMPQYSSTIYCCLCLQWT